MIASFLKGLKQEIRDELHMWAPHDLGHTMDLAQQAKQRIRNLKASLLGFGGSHRFIPNNYPTSGTYPTLNSHIHHRLTESRIQERRVKGLCYKCNEKWSKGHRCKTQINVTLFDDLEDPEYEGDSDQEQNNIDPATLDLLRWTMWWKFY